MYSNISFAFKWIWKLNILILQVEIYYQYFSIMLNTGLVKRLGWTPWVTFLGEVLSNFTVHPLTTKVYEWVLTNNCWDNVETIASMRVSERGIWLSRIVGADILLHINRIVIIYLTVNNNNNNSNLHLHYSGRRKRKEENNKV